MIDTGLAFYVEIFFFWKPHMSLSTNNVLPLSGMAEYPISILEENLNKDQSRASLEKNMEERTENENRKDIIFQNVKARCTI